MRKSAGHRQEIWKDSGPGDFALGYSAGVSLIPKSSHPARIRENYDVWDFELTAEEMKQISSMDKGKELFFEHDSPKLARMFGNYRIPQRERTAHRVDDVPDLPGNRPVRGGTFFRHADQ